MGWRFQFVRRKRIGVRHENNLSHEGVAILNLGLNTLIFAIGDMAEVLFWG